jgi:sporulation protein YlmC with PRC-barrel domain
MKARVCLVASALLFAGQAWAEDSMTPKSDPGLPAPAPAATEPAPAPAPQTEAATPAPAPAPQQQAEVPEEVVITELTAVDDNKKLVTPWALPADRVAEMDVCDKNGKKIGEVDAVLQDKKGEIKGVAVVHGGFLGFGSKDSIITLDRLQLKDGDIVTELTEDQLSQQPEWMKK